jgi:hypothetical protein
VLLALVGAAMLYGGVLLLARVAAEL